MAGLVTKASGEFTVATAREFAAPAAAMSWPSDSALLVVGLTVTAANAKAFSAHLLPYPMVAGLTAVADGDTITAASALAFTSALLAQPVYLGRTDTNGVLLSGGATGDVSLTVYALDAAPSFVELSNVLNGQLSDKPSGQYVMVVEKR